MPGQASKATSQPRDTRALALSILRRVERQAAFASRLLDQTISRTKMDERARGLLYELVMGTLRWQGKLDHALAQVSDRPPDKMDPTTRCILRLGAYQILEMQSIPDRAAVNETVNLSAEYARGFINRILRDLARKKDSLEWPGQEADLAERISIIHSHPRWLVERLLSEWGEFYISGGQQTEAFCAANQEVAALTLRVNTLRTDREPLISLLASHGIASRPGPLSPVSLIIEDSGPPKDLPGFKQGFFAVQDEASQLVGLLLDARPGESVLDACAAPGTKSLQLFQMMKKKGRLIASDIHPGRLGLLTREARRLGLSGVKLQVADLTKPFTIEGEKKGILFDRILIDAPCTGLGTLRRHPEIKWNRSPEDIKKLARTQKQIVNNLTKYLRPEGVLVYSTCTLLREENEDVIEPLISKAGFTLEDAAQYLPPAPGFPAVSTKVLRTLPHCHGTDGFTAFRMRKP
jgi:16S rRNA (cytosine967-C5)-methyltransferase